MQILPVDPLSSSVEYFVSQPAVFAVAKENSRNFSTPPHWLHPKRRGGVSKCRLYSQAMHVPVVLFFYNSFTFFSTTSPFTFLKVRLLRDFDCTDRFSAPSLLIPAPLALTLPSSPLNLERS